MELENQIADIKAYALSNEDINTILEPDTKIFSYPEFAKMSSIDEAFDKLGRCVFLFLTKSETSGHWVCMFKKGNDIEYFSSYGDKPEEERKWLNEEQLDELGQDEPYLMNLLKQSGYKVYYNTHSYQSDREDINTCGRWCVARLITKDISNKEFYNLVREQMKERGLKNADDWVALFTYEFLGK
jgi:hypothetical protein